MSAVARPAVTLHAGSAEALKWLALVAMTVDHVNTFLLGGSSEALYAFGRIAFPIFAFVLGCNMARPGADLWRLLRRLVGFGILAAAPFLVLTGKWLPLNVMFTFAAAACFIGLCSRGWEPAAVVLFGIAGLFVDYHWPGLLLILATFVHCRTGSRASFFAILAGFASLAWPNGNHWALLAFPIIVALGTLEPRVPRLRWAFYAYYPVHLALLAALTLAGVGAAHG